MSDIVKELRENAMIAEDYPGDADILRQAADEIERLRGLVLQWQTIAMRAHPSVASETWRRDLDDLKRLSQ